jgi:hypothetical protein
MIGGTVAHIAPSGRKKGPAIVAIAGASLVAFNAYAMKDPGVLEYIPFNMLGEPDFQLLGMYTMLFGAVIASVCYDNNGLTDFHESGSREFETNRVYTNP